MSLYYPITLLGAQWATDAACLVREGHPLPDLDSERGERTGRAWISADGWSHFPENVAVMELVLQADGHRRGISALRVHRRFRHLLRSCSRIDRVKTGDQPTIRGWVDGQIVFVAATVNPTRLKEGLTDELRADFPTLGELLALAGGTP